jgi:hypothetical protein
VANLFGYPRTHSGRIALMSALLIRTDHMLCLLACIALIDAGTGECCQKKEKD